MLAMSHQIVIQSQSRGSRNGWIRIAGVPDQAVVHSYLGGCPGREIRILVIGQALYSRHSWSGFRRCNPSFDRLEPEAKTMLPAEIG
jgi:hypothetical protein